MKIIKNKVISDIYYCSVEDYEEEGIVKAVSHTRGGRVFLDDCEYTDEESREKAINKMKRKARERQEWNEHYYIDLGAISDILHIIKTTHSVVLLSAFWSFAQGTRLSEIFLAVANNTNTPSKMLSYFAPNPVYKKVVWDRKSKNFGGAIPCTNEEGKKVYSELKRIKSKKERAENALLEQTEI